MPTNANTTIRIRAAAKSRIGVTIKLMAHRPPRRPPTIRENATKIMSSVIADLTISANRDLPNYLPSKTFSVKPHLEARHL